MQMVRDDPYIPDAFGKNKKGMSADETLSDADSVAAENVWRGSITAALFSAEELERLQVHKQQANRILEPYTHFFGVITGTEWDNFWTLRISKAAQPEFQGLATEMKRAYDASLPRPNKWHLPYRNDYGQDIAVALKVSAARCARVSYKTFEGKTSGTVDDLKLCDQLTAEFHMSPFDHPAERDTIIKKPYFTPRPPEVKKWHWFQPEDHRQFWGFIPYRVFVERELDIVGRRSSFEPIHPALVDNVTDLF